MQLMQCILEFGILAELFIIMCLNRLKEAQERYIAGGGKTNSNTYRRQAYDMEELANTIKYAEAELKTLEATGQAFKTATGTKEAMSDTEKLEQAERKLSDMHNKLQTSYTGINDKINESSHFQIGINIRL